MGQTQFLVFKISFVTFRLKQ